MNVKYKSEQNSKAAELLLTNSNENEDYYMSIIHCAYYSCIQLIKYVLCSECNMDYSLQEIESKKDKYGSHIYLINTIKYNMLKKSNSKYAIREVEKEFYRLKILRVKSDYTEIEIVLNDATKAIKRANSINRSINKIFN